MNQINKKTKLKIALSSLTPTEFVTMIIVREIKAIFWRV